MAKRSKESTPGRVRPTGVSPAVVLLADEPSKTDDFDAKAHGKVADAIADLIETESGGKVIGLEGSWGSGKSTVIELLRDRLHSDGLERRSDVLPIVFDAWAHQGDPLRRTFLDKVVDEFARSDWLDAKTAQKFRSALSGRVTRTNTRTTARLSLEGRLSSAAAILIPLGVVLASNQFHTLHRPALYSGLALLLGPLFVVAGFALTKWIAVWTGGRDEPDGLHHRLANLRTFSYFANEQDTDTTTEGIEGGVPTSVEFERLFSQILAAALRDDRRLLVVLDNLDRVEETDARMIFSTMQTFNGSASLRHEAWAPQVWTLIPYDPVGLDRIWERQIAEAHADQTLGASTAAAFVEKVFQVRFESPPMVLSDWRRYLLSQIAQAMPGVDSHEFDNVVRLRALYPGVAPTGLVAAEAPTPRQLKQFVNQIGVIRRLRDDVPLAHIAYFVLLRKDRFNVAEGLVGIDQSLPHARLSHLLTPTVQDDLAALHFGTSRALASQLLLRGALDQAFTNGDAATVEKLIGRTGFVDALEALDLGSQGANGGVELTTSVAVLSRAGALHSSTLEPWVAAVLDPAAERCSNWTLSGRDSGIGIAFLLRRISLGDDVLLADLLARVGPIAVSADLEPRAQLEGLASLADELTASDSASESLHVRMALPDESVVAALDHFASLTVGKRSWAIVELSQGPAEVAAVVSAAACSDNHTIVGAAFDVLMERPERVDLKALAENLIQWLRDNEPSSPQQLETMVRIVDTVRRSTGDNSILDLPADDGTLMHQFSFANRQGWAKQAGTISMLHLYARPALPEPQQVRDSYGGTQTLRDLLQSPAQYSQIVAGQQAWLVSHSPDAVDILLLVSANSNNRPWVELHLRELESSSALSVTANVYLANWHFFQTALGDEGFVRLTQRMLGDSDNRATILVPSATPSFARTILAAMVSSPDADSARDVRKWARDMIKSATTQTWQEQLNNPAGGPVVDLALQLSDTKERAKDPVGLSEALHLHFQTLAGDQSAWQPDGETFNKVVGLLGSGPRRMLASQICAALEGRDLINPRLFVTYGGFLSGESAFRTHAKLFNVVERLIAHDQWDAVQWVNEMAERHADTVQPTGREGEKQHLSQRVKDKIFELGDGATPQALAELSQLLS
ncbi:MAG: KAP family NTPase [Actinomycetia bacterium]|nr:KAP family NTPase [Actinomycetes bacterium]